MDSKPENKNHLKAQTLENFILRYGSEDGKQKWDEYIQKLKKRVPAKNPKSKKDWNPIQLIKHYDTEKTICIENIPTEFIEKFELVWNELKDKNPKFDSIQLYSKTCKSLFSAKSQIKKDYWLQRFWSDLDAEEKANSKRQMQVANEEWYVKKYGEEKGKKLWSEKCASSNLLENWTKKFGVEKAAEMWGEYKTKLSEARSLEGYQKKHGIEKGLELWNEWLSIQGRNESYFIKKYGDILGRQKWSDIIESRKYYASLEGMISRYGQEEGTERYNRWYEATRKGKDYYIKKYGEVEGMEIFNDINFRRVESWKKSSTLESFKERYGDEKGTQKWIDWKTFYGNYSKNSFNLFSRLVEEFPEFKNASFGENEALIDTQDIEFSQDFLKPDFLWNNKVIEFNGTYWHRDSRFFDDSIENLKIRKRDELRLSALREKGYDVKIVWEADYENDPFKILDECVVFLKNIV